MDTVDQAAPSPEPPPPVDSPPVSRLEIGAVIVLGIVSAFVVAIMADGIWFQKDAWDYLAFRDLTDVSSLMEPHGDHWLAPTAILVTGLHEAVGIDFWPWYYLPRLIGHVLMIAALWATLRLRGTDRLVAFGAFAVLLFMGTSSWQLPSTFGNLIVFPTMWFAALIIWRVERPTIWHRLAVFGLLLLGIIANSMAVAGIAGFGLATLLYRRVLQWWPSIGAVGLIYVWWYLTYRGFGETSGAALPEPLEAADFVATVLGNALTRTLGLPVVLGIGLVVAFLGFVGWLVKTRRLDVFDAALLLSLAFYFVLIVSIRFSGGGASPDHVRWSQRVALLIVPVVLPKIRVSRAAWGRVAVVAVLLIALVGNLLQLERNLDGEARRAQLRRSFAESAAQLIADGEPYQARRRLNQARTGPLTAADLDRVVADGWAPTRDWGEAAVQDARARLRLSVAPRGRIRGTPPTTTAPLVETADGLCTTVPAGERVAMTVRRPATIRLETPRASRIDLRWEDEFGIGLWRRADFGLRGTQLFVATIAPTTTATLTVISIGEATEVCGLAPA